ncbi:MAG: flagellar M-ring protein FliF [bacterium]|nr:flagellar M-ring protein FliF [bacterium]
MNEFIQQLREQLARMWEQLSIQQKVIFVAIPVLLIITMGISVYYVSRPKLVTLLSSSDAGQLSEVTQYLDSKNVQYKLSDDGRSILVDSEVKSKTAIDLAGQGLIGFDAGAGFELFDKVNLGMTDKQFDVQYRRVIQNMMAETIVEGARIDRATVTINPGRQGLFERDKIDPSASVKVVARRDLDPEEVKGIQNLVAASWPGLKPRSVTVSDSRNRTISEETDVEPGVAEASRQFQVQATVENYIKNKLEAQLMNYVGPDSYEVTVNAVLDWEQEKQKKIEIENQSPAPISEKTYTESTKQQGIAGPPGVSSNVQDTGIGAETQTTGTDIEETITNTNYPWSETLREKSQGAIQELKVLISIDQVEQADGTYADRDPAVITQWEEGLRLAAGLPATPQPGEPISLRIVQVPFDRSLEQAMSRQQFWESMGAGFRTVLPLLLLLAVGYLAYLFFQRAFAPAEIEEEEMEEEVPIEPVTEARELTLQQLGLAEFGDIANLPAEEQRRLKMQEHVINYAAEKPEEVAAIIKAWLAS